MHIFHIKYDIMFSFSIFEMQINCWKIWALKRAMRVQGKPTQGPSVNVFKLPEATQHLWAEEKKTTDKNTMAGATPSHSIKQIKQLWGSVWHTNLPMWLLHIKSRNSSSILCSKTTHKFPTHSFGDHPRKYHWITGIRRHELLLIFSLTYTGTNSYHWSQCKLYH